jgi:hypothetical protein
MLLIVGIVTLSSAFAIRKMQMGDVNDAPLGWMSAHWLAEHRAYYSPSRPVGIPEALRYGWQGTTGYIPWLWHQRPRVLPVSAAVGTTLNPASPLVVPSRLTRAGAALGDVLLAVAVVLSLPFMMLAIGIPFVLGARLLFWVVGFLGGVG